ncbi:MAG: hypothetical protein OEQ16_05270 [Gammaproteobacteria bacterium]|nr:hypothetical protein [Gammaproteobacteria bacterium]MDH4005998.1 hypothetical protein [Gammaproteobacteria bacterium]
MTKLIPVLLLLLTACTPAPPDMDELAREYLYLELSMGLHDPAHVDAYFGPEEIRTAAEETALTLDQILAASQDLATKLIAVNTGGDRLFEMRVASLIARLQALDTRIAINKGESFSFDEESQLIFGTQAPDYDAAHFQAILDKVDALLPGEAPLSERVESFNNQFVIPIDKMDDVFTAAMDECRRRTLENMDLPEHESFTIEYVNDKPWTGYNWYQGNAQSLIQLNTDFPMYISKAVDLGCHEGYPGHHTFNALLEKNLVDDKGWLEVALYPLFSPQSVIAEGSGNYGIDLAFPGDERMQFEKDVLFPLAGLDAGQADLYYKVSALVAQLDFADNEAARDYLNGDMTRDEAVAWVQTYELEREDKSMQRTRFFDAYRSYVINYNHGKALVADYVERNGADADERWTRFEKMLSSPMLPADLQK